MPRFLIGITLVLAVTIMSGALTPAVAHFDDKQMHQSYRQSWFALVAMNFGPMVSTVKQEIPWDDQRMKGWSTDLATLTTLNIMRGFTDGSERGTTRAKPGIWENKADFESKMDDLAQAASALKRAVDSGDRKQVAEQVQATGGACKACHDDYKSDDYLY